jgi:hypothetical protein
MLLNCWLLKPIKPRRKGRIWYLGRLCTDARMHAHALNTRHTRNYKMNVIYCHDKIWWEMYAIIIRTRAYAHSLRNPDERSGCWWRARSVVGKFYDEKWSNIIIFSSSILDLWFVNCTHVYIIRIGREDIWKSKTHVRFVALINK